MDSSNDIALIKLAEEIAAEKDIPLKKGVYVGGTGPSYETPAEYKYFRLIGGDVFPSLTCLGINTKVD